MRYSRFGARWSPLHKKRGRARLRPHLRRPRCPSHSRSVPSKLDRNRPGRILRSRSPGLSPRRSRPQRRRRRVSRCGLPSRSELRPLQARRHRCRRVRLEPPRLHVRPTRLLVRQPQLPRPVPAVPRLLHPRLQRLQRPRFVPRPLRPLRAPGFLRRQQARNPPGLRHQRRLQPDLQGRPASAPRTPSFLRIQR